MSGGEKRFALFLVASLSSFVFIKLSYSVCNKILHGIWKMAFSANEISSIDIVDAQISLLNQREMCVKGRRRRKTYSETCQTRFGVTTLGAHNNFTEENIEIDCNQMCIDAIGIHISIVRLHTHTQSTYSNTERSNCSPRS